MTVVKSADLRAACPSITGLDKERLINARDQASDYLGDPTCSIQGKKAHRAAVVAPSCGNLQREAAIPVLYWERPVKLLEKTLSKMKTS